MLKTFEQCPKKFMFRYVKNISMPTNDDIFATGKNIHALASYYLRKENINNMEQSLSQQESAIWEYLKNVNYLSYDVVNTEYNLSAKIGKHFFGGRLDALVKDKDTYYILDYKTGSAPKNSKYDFQTMIYLLCVKKFFKTDKVNFVYLDLKNKTEVKIELNEDLAKEYEQKLTDISDKIDKSEYTAKPNSCNTCEYRIICYDKKLSY